MEAETGAPTFWGSSERAQKHIAKLNGLKRAIAGVVAFHRKLDDAAVMVELIGTATGAEKDQYGRELDQTVEVLVAELDQLELASFLSGQFDRNNAILSIQAGAGGTESCDWTDMLFRMYNRWAERRGFSLEVQDVQAGDQAGITKATLVIKGENAYGYVKAERGVHRLVRISPFDANKRRHTSFAAVDVVAEITEEIAIEMQDRFGPPPQAARNLVHLMRLKTELRRLRVLGCEANTHAVTLHLADDHPLDSQKLIELVQKHTSRFKVSPDMRLTRKATGKDSWQSGIDALEALLAEIAHCVRRDV